MTRVLLLAAWSLAASSAFGAEWVQENWQGGAVLGSTTSQTTGWKGYDSQDGNAVVLSTGLQSRQGLALSWAQTDEGATDTGFNQPGAAFSSATVSGAGAAAQIRMALSEAVITKAETLPSERKNASAAQHSNGKIYVFGGNDNGALPSRQDSIIEHNPLTGSVTLKAAKLPSGRFGAYAAYHPGVNKIYVFGGNAEGGYSNEIVEYNPATDSAVVKSTTLPIERAGAPAVYHPGTGKIYVFGGSSSPGLGFDDIIEYDPVTDSRVVKSTTLPSGRSHASAAYHPGTGKIYIFGGGGSGSPPGPLAEIVEYDPVADARVVKASTLPVASYGASAIYHPGTGKIYVFGGAFDDTDLIVEYDPVADIRVTRPITFPGGSTSAAAYSDDIGGILLYSCLNNTYCTAGDPPSIWEYRFNFRGTYASAVFDTKNLSSLGSLSWNPAAQFSPSVNLTLGFRAGNTPAPSGSWTNSGAFAAAANGGSLSAFSPNRYVQYIATFTTTNPSTGPVLNDITIAYTQTAPSATLVSSAFDSGNALNVIQKIRWQGNFPADTLAQFQVRSASDNGSGFPAAWGPWLGPSSSSDYFTDPAGSDDIHPDHKDGVDDRFFQYRAVLVSSNTLAAPTLSTVTVIYNFLPGAPALDPLTADTSAQITAAWTDNSTTEDTFVLSSGTASGPTNLGTAVATADKTGTGGAQSAAIAGLSANTRYYARVRAKIGPPDDLFSFYSNERNIATLANAPANPSISIVHVSSVSLSWSPEGNSAITPYELSASTDNFTLNFSTPVQFAANLTAAATALLNLSPGTTYYFRVRARNDDGALTAFSGIVSTVTRPSPLSGLNGAALGVSSISWTWNLSGAGATRYRVSSASAGAVMADLAVPPYLQTGLSTNTAYGLRVEPYNNTASAGLSLPTTVYTQAAAPASLSVAAVSSTTVALAWSANQNPAGTPFELSVSTDNFATHFSTPASFAAGLTAGSTVVLNLAAGTTYYFRVRARNGDLLPTLFSNVPSTQTLPGALGPPAGAALGVSSISWSWTNTAGPSVKSYSVFRASSAALLATVSAPAFNDAGLSTNTAYGIRVVPVNDSGGGPLSPAATAYTQAAVPAATSITAVHISSIALSWNPNQNPGGTVFEAHRSTDNAAFALASSLTAAALTDAGLLPGNTYYYRVRAVNGDGLAATFDVTVSTFLIGDAPLPPSGLIASFLDGGRVQLSWAPSPTAGVPQYNIYWDAGTGAVSYGVTFSTVSGSTTSFTTEILAPGTYYFALRAKNPVLEEQNTQLVASVIVPPATPSNWVQAQIRTPKSGKKVWGNRVTVLAGIFRGSPLSAKQVEFQYRSAVSTTAPWIQIPAVAFNNPDPSPPYLVHWNVTGLPAGDYEIRAVASNLDGQPDPAPPTRYLTIDSSDPDIEETLQGASSIRHREKVFDAISNGAVLGSLSGEAVHEVTLPSGALGTAGPVVLRILSPPLSVPAAPRELSITGISYEITLENGQTQLNVPAFLSAGYRDDNDDGLVDGTLARTDRLAFMFFNAASGRWQKEAASSVDLANKTVTVQTGHFSTFGMFSPAAADLSSVRVYPVPFVAHDGNDDNGKPFNSADPTSGIIFDNLTQNARVEIYTVSGELVWERSTASSSGKIQWDVRNARGQELATGGYIALIRDPATGQKVVRKIAIIR